MKWHITPYRRAKAGAAYTAGTTLHLEAAGLGVLAGGAGGWESLARPRMIPATAWVGGSSTTLSLPIMLDGIARYGSGRDGSVEGECAAIRAWGMKHPVTGEPPRLRVVGMAGVTGSVRWVVQDITWGDHQTDAKGRRVRQELTLSLLLHVEPSLVSGPARKARAKTSAKPKGKT